MWTHKPGGRIELRNLIQSTNNKGLFVNVCIKIGHTFLILLDIRLHVYICPCYTAKTVVKFFSTPTPRTSVPPLDYATM